MLGIDLTGRTSLLNNEDPGSVRVNLYILPATYLVGKEERPDGALDVLVALASTYNHKRKNPPIPGVL